MDDGSPVPDVRTLEEKICLLGIACRVYYMQENSGGPAKPRNIGVRLASGDYVAFLDQDDIWEPSHLEDSSQYLYSNDIDIVSSGYYLFGRSVKDNTIFRPRNMRVTQSRLRQMGNVVVLSSVVARKGVLETYSFSDEFIWEDFELWYRIAGDKELVMVTRSDVNVGYRVSQGSRSDGIEKTMEGLRELLRYVSRKDLLCSRWYILASFKAWIRLLMRRLWAR